LVKNRWIFRKKALRHGGKGSVEVGAKPKNLVTGDGIKGYGAQTEPN
jgi:hypothetical protein